MKFHTALLTVALITGFAVRSTAQPAAGSLQVVLTTVSAGVTTGNKIAISWTTRQQTNADYFNVEKSSDCISWQTIALVKSSGYTAVPVTYAVVDIFPLKGSNFYRIRFTGLNGETACTAVKNVRMGTGAVTNIYPNPSINLVTVSLAQVPLRDWQLCLINNMGKVIFQKKYSSTLTTITLPVVNYPNGIYTMQIDDGYSSQSKKLMINHN